MNAPQTPIPPERSGPLNPLVAVLVVGITVLTWNAINARQTEAATATEVKDAEEEKQRAEQQLRRAEMLVYQGKLALAQREWQANDTARAIELLDECQWNLRGWEHRHVWTLVNSNQRTFH